MAERVNDFAALADIHGNCDALRAVLADMDRLGIGAAVNLGDHFSGPLDAAGTAELLRKRDFLSIRGNHDRYLIEQAPDAMGPSDRVAFNQLGAADLDWLRGLPATRRYGPDIFLCHGTPASDSAYWLEKVRDDGFVGLADLSWIEAQAAAVDASLILCGHTHVKRSARLSDGRLIVNPGSVGCPGYVDDQPRDHVMQTGTPAACYAILHRAPLGWDVTFREVPYDTARMVALAEAQGRAEWARAIQSGWVDG